MAHELIADRFLADGSGRSVDLATGETADVIVRSLEPEQLETEWPAIDVRLREEYHASRAVRLIDYGLVNTNQWFEARAPVRRQPGTRDVRSGSALEEIVAAAEAGAPGLRHVPIITRGVEGTRMAEAIARRLSRLGFITVNADLDLPAALRRALTHRHVVVHFRSESDRAPVVRWIRDLADVSPRAHVVVEMTRSAARQMPARASPKTARITRGAFGSDVISAANWKTRVSIVARRAHALMDRSRIELAEALLAAMNAEAAVRRDKVPRAIDLTWARLRTLQGRDDDARRFAAGLANGRFGERTDGSGSRDSSVAAAGSRR